MIDPALVQNLNEEPVQSGDYVLYWMQAAQRTVHNPALEYAAERANQLKLPLVVCFGLMDDYPEANERHYHFLVEGLAETQAKLQQRGIQMCALHGPAVAAALTVGRRAAMIVCDRNYLRHHKQWRSEVAAKAGKAVVQVETEVVVPVQTVSDKHEFAARTIRPKIHRHLQTFLKPLTTVKVRISSMQLKLHSDFDLTDVDGTMKKLKLDRSVGRTTRLIGGQGQAEKLLKEFVANDLHGFSQGRNDPAEQRTSLMSAYLHFGQVSPVHIALAVQDSGAPAADRDSYLEELIVRRELSMNFAQFVTDYDNYEMLPEWARKTLAEHRHDPREYHYSLEQLEKAQTHDPYWNAAQTEMVCSGFMHNYMRMYWGKKILEWSTTPQQGFKHTLHINNKYLLDGRDANSFANVGWIYGLHDRPWGPQRKIFGLIRYMNAAGLERKFDIKGYLSRVDAMQAQKTRG